MICFSRFASLEKLGKQLLRALPDSLTIKHKLKTMTKAKLDIQADWDKRNQQLRDALDLAVSKSKIQASK